MRGETNKVVADAQSACYGAGGLMVLAVAALHVAPVEAHVLLALFWSLLFSATAFALHLLDAAALAEIRFESVRHDCIRVECGVAVLRLLARLAANIAALLLLFAGLYLAPLVAYLAYTMIAFALLRSPARTLSSHLKN